MKKQIVLLLIFIAVFAILINQKSYEDMIIDGIKTQMKLFRKEYIDIYIISENEADSKNKKFYNKTYYGSISIVSQCLSTEKDDCELSYKPRGRLSRIQAAHRLQL